MSERIKVFLDDLNAIWSSDTTDFYPYMEDIFVYLEDFSEICVKVISRSKNNLCKVIDGTAKNIHRLAVEILHASIIGQRISMYPLNRSMHENLIVLSFIIKHGEKAAVIFIENSNVEFYKLGKKRDTTLRGLELEKVENAIKRIRNRNSQHKLGSGFEWANLFLGNLRNDRCELKDLAEDSNQQDVYSELSLLHQQTHSASFLAHYFNIDTFNSYNFYSSLIIMMVESLKRCVEILPELEDSERKTFYLLHNKIKKQHKNVLEKGSKKTKK